jgi:alanine racemase
MMVAVATLDEALELRKNKIDQPILVFGLIRVKDLKLASKHEIIVTAHSVGWIKESILKYHGNSVDVHIKVDTGMHRLGIVKEQDFLDGYGLLQQSLNLNLTGIYSHFASADEEISDYYEMQHQKFLDLIDKVDSKNLLIHIDNSSATLQYPKSITGAIRLGITIYGLKPTEKLSMPFELKPVLSLYTKLMQVKRLPKHSLVSYNGLYETSKDEWIGTIPIGYADGWDRRMEYGEVFIDGQPCPIVGRICMDYCMVRLPKKYKDGTIVELIGPHISVDDIAKKIHTNNYQTTCALSDRIVRVYQK